MLVGFTSTPEHLRSVTGTRTDDEGEVANEIRKLLATVFSADGPVFTASEASHPWDHSHAAVLLDTGQAHSRHQVVAELALAPGGIRVFALLVDHVTRGRELGCIDVGRHTTSVVRLGLAEEHGVAAGGQGEQGGHEESRPHELPRKHGCTSFERAR
jgi:hypothetical protein